MARARMSQSFAFNRLRIQPAWLTECENIGMSLAIIVLILQVAVTVFCLVRESGEDSRFEGDKLGFRS